MRSSTRNWPFRLTIPFGLILSLALRGPVFAEAPAPGSGDAPVPEESMFASVRQAVNEDFDHEVVRGHFDVGAPPDARRYYCLVVEKKGKRQPNGVAGQPVLRADGMTGIKGTAVSTYSCASAEQKGILVTAGYVLTGRAATSTAPANQPAKASAAGAPAATAVAPAVTPVPAAAVDVPGGADVAGVKIGMSLDQVRGVLKARKARNYFEATDTLGQSAHAARFVNIVAAWTPPMTGDAAGGAWDSVEVVFTPVPGRERAMAIIHSAAQTPSTVMRERALKDALTKKYGAMTGAAELPPGPTWLMQAGGAAQVGDSCSRRSVIGGMQSFFAAGAARRNLALTTTLDELQYQIDRCGVTIVTEDHLVANVGAPVDERTVARYTVTAYSPALALEGAKTAAQLLQAPGDSDAGVGAPSAKSPIFPNL